MPNRVVVGVVAAVAVVAVVVVLVGFGGKRDDTPVEVAEAAAGQKDGKAGPGPAGAPPGTPGNYARQHETLPTRVVIPRRAGKTSRGTEVEYDLRVQSTRTRTPATEMYRVVLVTQLHRWNNQDSTTRDEIGLAAEDAGAALRFLRGLEGKGKAPNTPVDSAYVDWRVRLRDWDGGATDRLFFIEYRYGKEFACGGPLDYPELLIGYLPEVLTEGLKDVEKLRAVPWSPLP